MNLFYMNAHINKSIPNVYTTIYIYIPIYIQHTRNTYIQFSMSEKA